MTPPSDDLVKRQPETVREIGYEEAHEIAKRFIDFFFGNLGEKPRVCIPARPEYDDDICLHSFIAQQRIALTRFCAELAEMEKCKNTYATLAYERQEQLFKLRAELAEAKRMLTCTAWVQGGRCPYLERVEQAEAARDRFAAVIACRNIRAYAPLKEYCRVGEAAYPNCWTRMKDEAIAHHRAKQEEKNRG